MARLSPPLPTPGAVWGHYPENPAPWPERHPLSRWLDRLAERLAVRLPIRQAARRGDGGAPTTGSPAPGRAPYPSTDLASIRGRLRKEGLAEGALDEALRHVGDVAGRTLGQTPYPVQLQAARLVIAGHLAEMATGEGKSLTVALAAACCALAGMPVHVMTANDYLVARDARTFAPLYAQLGLRVGFVTAASSPDERRTAYACDITYCTAKEVVFDYLRDELVRAPSTLHWHAGKVFDQTPATSLRGLCMAIVDEADSILIDEAKVPLILSQSLDRADEAASLRQALALARGLQISADFRVDRQHRFAALTEAGEARIERLAGRLSNTWRNRTHRNGHVTQALVALHALQRDQDYLVAADGIQIIDPTTGRIAVGRQWSLGLHQLVEMKEGLTPSAANTTVAALTYQHFFPRYCHLGGLSGTLTEAASELHTTYGLTTRRVPLRRPSRRNLLPTRLFPDQHRLWQAIAARARALQTAGRPVLVGTGSIEDSEALSAVMTEAGLRHVVLNARHDAQEASIVEQAGLPGQITIATNMAGRGTDIHLGPGVAEAGGLHVINSQVNRARRIDRQLIGRCARQGDPGSAETWLALDDPLIRAHCPPLLRPWLARAHTGTASPIVALLLRLIQIRCEREDYRQRKRLAEQDRHLDRKLAFNRRQGSTPD